MRESLFIVRRPCGHIVGAYVDHPDVTKRFGEEIADALRRGDRVACEVVTAPVKIGGDCEHGGACKAEPRDIFIGCKPCGCVVAACRDMPDHQDDVREELTLMLADGLSIDKVTVSESRRRLKHCPHRADGTEIPPEERPCDRTREMFPFHAEEAITAMTPESQAQREAPLTAEQLVAQLDNRDVNEIRSVAIHEAAARAGLVFAWYEDDEEIVELRGAILDGYQAWVGGFALLTIGDGVLAECEHENGDGCRYYQRAAEGAVRLTLHRATKETPYPVLAFDAVPSLPFLARENGAVASRGVVFSRAALGNER